MAKLHASLHPVAGRSVDEHRPLKTVGFLVIPNFTTIGFASAVETLRIANMAARQTMFRTVIIAANMEPVMASNGMRLLPDYTSPMHQSWICCSLSDQTLSSLITAAYRYSTGSVSWRMIKCP